MLTVPGDEDGWELTAAFGFRVRFFRPSSEAAEADAAATSASAEDGIDWRTDLDAARKEAARTNRPLLIVFR